MLSCPKVLILGRIEIEHLLCRRATIYYLFQDYFLQNHPHKTELLDPPRNQIHITKHLNIHHHLTNVNWQKIQRVSKYTEKAYSSFPQSWCLQDMWLRDSKILRAKWQRSTILRICRYLIRWTEAMFIWSSIFPTTRSPQ